MTFPASEAIALLRSWHEDGSWIYVQASFKNSGEQQSWAQVAQVSETEVFFAGEDGFLPVSVTNCSFEHIGLDHLPEIVRKRFREADCCLFMRFDGGSALIYGSQWSAGLMNRPMPA